MRIRDAAFETRYKANSDRSHANKSLHIREQLHDYKSKEKEKQKWQLPQDIIPLSIGGGGSIVDSRKVSGGRLKF